MMTAKHFKAIAKIISQTTIHNYRYPVNALIEKDNLTRIMADYLATQNPQFNKDRFYQACGYEQGESNPY